LEKPRPPTDGHRRRRPLSAAAAHLLTHRKRDRPSRHGDESIYPPARCAQPFHAKHPSAGGSRACAAPELTSCSRGSRPNGACVTYAPTKRCLCYLCATQYIYDHRSTFLEYDETGTQVAKYDYGDDRMISQTRKTGTRFCSYDALGSMTNLSNVSGDLAASYHLDAWGRYRYPAELAGSPNRFGFTGYLFDRETGLYYARARYYESAFGRFATQDSFLGAIDNPPSLHRYSYAQSRPTALVDPTGHYSEGGHYYTIFIAARSVGYSEIEAGALAFYAQLPDETTELDAVAAAGQLGSAEIGFALSTSEGYVSPELLEMRNRVVAKSLETQEVLHALNGGVGAEETAATLNAIAEARYDPVATGLLLHRLGDSFAHRKLDSSGELFKGPVGHGLEGHAPDVVLNRPDLHVDYTRALTRALARRRGLSEEETAAAVERTGRLLELGEGDVESEARRIVARYVARNPTVGVRHEPSEPASVELGVTDCLAQEECRVDAFLDHVKRKARELNASSYSPEEVTTGEFLGGALSDKPIEEALIQAGPGHQPAREGEDG